MLLNENKMTIADKLVIFIICFSPFWNVQIDGEVEIDSPRLLSVINFDRSIRHSGDNSGTKVYGPLFPASLKNNKIMRNVVDIRDRPNNHSRVITALRVSLCVLMSLV